MAKSLNELKNKGLVKSSLKHKVRRASSSASEIAILLEVVQKLSLAKDLETIMFFVRKAARKLANADGALLILRNADQGYNADKDVITATGRGKRFPLKTFLSDWVMEHRQSVIIEDTLTDSRIPIEVYRPSFVKSLAMVPIRIASPLGTIGTYWAENYCPTEEQLNLLQSLADSTSVAIENIQLYSMLEKGLKETSAQVEITKKLIETNRHLESALAELNHRNKEMFWLKELSSHLQTALYAEEAYHLVAQYTQKLLSDVAGALYLIHPSRNYLEAMISWGPLLFEEKVIKPEECLALRRGSIHKVEQPQKELSCAHAHKDGNQPYSCIPLFAQSDVIGLLYLEWQNYNKDNQEFVDKKNNQDILASMIAEQIAIGISNIKLRETLRTQSLRDSLTGLYNRRYLEETLEREISRCQRKSTPLVVMMIDIDCFKQINDRFGHEAGDIIMQSLANVLRNFARKSDIVCRYGGEEFLLVMPELDLDTAFERAKLLHEAVSHIHLRYGGNALSQITLSVGIAAYPLHGNNMHDLIAASDIALYEAKNSGRNKTVLYELKISENLGKDL